MKKDLAYVLVQFVLFAVYFIDWNIYQYKTPNAIQYIALLCSAFGLLIIIMGIFNLNTNLTPFPSPKKGAKLIKGGIYQYVRHPIYTGLFIALLFYSIYAGSPFRTSVALLLLLVFYYKSRYEEVQLTALFPSYEKYKTVTGRFFPLLYRKS